MSTDNEMDRAWRQDQVDQRKIDTMRRHIEEFLAAGGPERLSDELYCDLSNISRQLKERSDHITAVWD